MLAEISDVVQAIAELLKAVAWPAVVVFVLVRYRDHVGRLIDRLREIWGSKLDPVQAPQQKKPEETLQSVSSSGALERARTPAVRRVEQILTEIAILAAETDPARRESYLLTIAAKALLVSQYERIETSIWASQIELLNYVNSRTDGDTKERLRELFYQPASQRYPEFYRNYTIDGYLAFLAQWGLIAITDDRVEITTQGVEYLVWRVEQKRLPKLFG